MRLGLFSPWMCAPPTSLAARYPQDSHLISAGESRIYVSHLFRLRPERVPTLSPACVKVRGNVRRGPKNCVSPPVSPYLVNRLSRPRAVRLIHRQMRDCIMSTKARSPKCPELVMDFAAGMESILDNFLVCPSLSCVFPALYKPV